MKHAKWMISHRISFITTEKTREKHERCEMGTKQQRKGSRRVPYLGKITTKWCPKCDMPLIRGTECPDCGTKLESPHIAPPGDVKIAFEYDKDLIRQTCDEMFGKGIGNYLIPSSSVILLNKIGDLDLNYQVFEHGKRIGNFTYDIMQGEYKFFPTLEGAKIIFKYLSTIDAFNQETTLPRFFVEYTLEAEKYAVKGLSILAPGIKKINTLVNYKDPCIVISRNGLIGVGYFTADQEEIERMLEENYGKIAKLKEYGEAIPLAEISKQEIYPPVTIDDVITINSQFISKNEESAISFIRKTVKRHDLPVAVAYSGGKDSLATLLLVLKAFNTTREERIPYIFFADTGLELPEVLENVDSVINWVNDKMKAKIESAGKKFWELARLFGPPGRDFRYCCHALKASQINEIVDAIISESDRDIERILVFLGQRRYESFSRAKDGKIYVNSYIPKQIIGAPIKDWNAFEEWLYLLREKMRDPSLPINSLYFHGHDRLGCYLCPAQNLADMERTGNTHPDLYNNWISFLHQYQQEHGFPLEWIKYGLWRFKEYTGQWKIFVEALPKAVIPQRREREKSLEEVKLMITRGVSPCTSGGFSVKAKISIPPMLEEFYPWFLLLDKRGEMDADSGVIYLDRNEIKFILFADGAIFMQFHDGKLEYRAFLQHFLGLVARSMFCKKCGVCVNVCPTQSIKNDKNALLFNQDKCLGLKCQQCTEHCPIYHVIRNNIIEVGENEDGSITG
ncbi:phosphoadenosine phosphosulfate reductase family protein [Candidatus Bathyarchaeota archaeon]|nr:phosphoadenosine phosphosulfate reductase family protein [Candidatus Bathyarchaeota archaeon]